MTSWTLAVAAAADGGGSTPSFEHLFALDGSASAGAAPGLPEGAEVDALALLTDGWLSDDDALLRGGAPTSPGSEGASGGSTECGAPRWRCLDASHSESCSECTAPPAEADERDYELRAKDGRKNGEKRLRGALARCREWLSHDTRCAAADALEATRPRLAAALRARHCVELRKADLLHLCRLWGYRSDVWAHRKDSRLPGAKRAPAAPPQPPALEQRLQLHGAPGMRDLQLATEPGAALGAAHALVACTLMPLARLAAVAFANTERSAWLVARLAAAPPAAAPVLQHALRMKVGIGSQARDTLARLGGVLRGAHEGAQRVLLSLRPEEGAREAYMALLSGADEQVTAVETVLPELLRLCQRAAAPAGTLTLPGTPPETLSAGDAHIGAGGRASTDLVRTAACTCGARPLLRRVPLLTRATSPLNTRNCRRQVTHVARLLRELQLCNYETYLNALSLVLGVLIGHVASTRVAMDSHLALLGVGGDSESSAAHSGAQLALQA